MVLEILESVNIIGVMIIGILKQIYIWIVVVYTLTMILFVIGQMYTMIN